MNEAVDSTPNPQEQIRNSSSRSRQLSLGDLRAPVLRRHINYIDRQVIGILKPTLQTEIGWTEVGYSWVVFSFQAAYAIGLLGVGPSDGSHRHAQRFSLSIIFWSLAAMGHALARTVFGFGVARFFLGLGEAGNFPAAIKTVAEWFPKKERALATGIFNAGTNIGALVTPLVVPMITIAWGWRAAFIITGAIGFILARCVVGSLSTT